MSNFKIGEKDQDGRQKRIEHTGKHLRISRTGGISLRKQAKLKGLNITANTTHGVRISHRVAKNTQIALQNNRLVLRGRYGRGPHRLNLSKSGISVSSKTPVGTFNWIKPNRSSFKVAGIHFRGKKAANMHVIYAVLSLLMMAAQMAMVLLSVALKALFFLVLAITAFISNLPGYIEETHRRWRNIKLKGAVKKIDATLLKAIGEWNEARLYAAVLLLLNSHGRGVPLEKAIENSLQHLSSNSAKWLQLTRLKTEFSPVADALKKAPADEVASHQLAMTQTVLIAQRLKAATKPENIIAYLLEVDEFLLAAGPKTKLQETLIQVFSDFTGLRFIAD